MWHSEQVLDYDPVKHGLPAREESVTPLEPGPCVTYAAVVSAGNAALLRVRVGVRAVGITVPDPRYMAFAIPVSWTGEYLINGETADRCAVYTPGDLDRFYLFGHSRDSIKVMLLRDTFTRSVAALRGVQPTDVTLNSRALESPPEFGAALRSRLAAIIDRSRDDAHRLDAEDFANEVVSLLTDAYLIAQPDRTPKSCRLQSPEKIVRKAEERFMRAQDGPVSLADLCVAAGVSKSALYLAYHNVCGEPPLTFFLKRRLSRARARLLNSAPERGAVKRAALGCGFTEFGRFAMEYRRLFGESPSATLHKSAC